MSSIRRVDASRIAFPSGESRTDSASGRSPAVIRSGTPATCGDDASRAALRAASARSKLANERRRLGRRLGAELGAQTNGELVVQLERARAVARSIEQGDRTA